MRLGFSIKVLGRPGLRSHDSRRWQNRPDLSVSRVYVRDILLYLDKIDVRMYRLSADLAPYLTHPALPAFHHQVETCEPELMATGALARDLGIRLSFHAPAYVLLNSPDKMRRHRSIDTLVGLTRIMEAMELGKECVIVLHVGGYYHDHQGALDAFARGFENLPHTVQKRLVLEADDRRFSVTDCVQMHQRLGVRIIFDFLHHRLLNPAYIPETQALAACLATWPPNQTPKIHVSTPATELVRDGRKRPHPPRLNRHSHYVNPFTFIDFLRALPKMRDFDVMLEARAKDLALLQLRKHLHLYAPELVRKFNIT